MNFILTTTYIENINPSKSDLGSFLRVNMENYRKATVYIYPSI